MDVKMKGKTALVAASSKGLGKAIAAALAEEGANIMLSGRNEAALQDAAQELNVLGGGSVSYVVCDLANGEDIKALVHKTAETHGSIDMLVNNVGGPKGGGLLELTDEDWTSSFELHLLSYIRLIRESLPYLKKSGGRIINIASSSVKQPIPGLLLSNTFRMGIVGLTKSLAEELAEHRILINTLAPGRIATDRVAELDRQKAEQTGLSQEEVKEDYEKQIPLGSYGKPEDFAQYASFLLSERNTYMTGQTLLIDGGMVKAI
ncbi:SDR family oxidoreductase [Bacillus sonorensis]|uniref:3-oxoacyl-(Acyl-carrier-protein) reductase FabG n=2 Tax=Bacillus sonorensis TaxID=119858 RepID=M5P523_9BACI|nr:MULTISPECIES: SDR family oxidoreductase [Bacillus]ASB89855.1 3-oxoacyl-[acyl-carrier-protein] reductase [Bacillus sonorensis]EME74529.1 3-oxoacyl-(acyl-carrier-protein) reductase FabG [Bacillus sonorensis L12]MBG9916907.1 3-oxoacyl-ACP reductase [Bacillus sonorensis]MCY8025107.1 SDR family oxidoreductase [Bacillus sonorensis]MCZ0073464.1 SDR family oxidoreductase [Bacillus sonorensis]